MTTRMPATGSENHDFRWCVCLCVVCVSSTECACVRGAAAEDWFGRPHAFILAHDIIMSGLVCSTCDCHADMVLGLVLSRLCSRGFALGTCKLRFVDFTTLALLISMKARFMRRTTRWFVWLFDWSELFCRTSLSVACRSGETFARGWLTEKICC